MIYILKQISEKLKICINILVDQTVLYASVNLELPLSTQIRRRDDIVWGVYFQGLVILT